MSPVLLIDQQFELDETGKRSLAKQYVEAVSAISVGAGLSPADISISSHALSLALAESAADIEIMTLRRKPKSGISKSKLAGIVAFRLSRFAPIHVCGKSQNHPLSGKINEMAALVLAMKSLVHLNIADVRNKHASQELQYTLLRRHMNQETLGLVFEILASVE